jgi:hypothetical protein
MLPASSVVPDGYAGNQLTPKRAGFHAGFGQEAVIASAAKQSILPQQSWIASSLCSSQ